MDSRSYPMNNLRANLPEAARQREELRAKLNREELVERIGRALPEDGTVEPVKGLHFARVSRHQAPIHGVSFPSFCGIAQGSKEMYLGEDRYRYDPYHYLLSTIELPIVIHHIEASPERPCLNFQLELDPALVASVMLDAQIPSPRKDGGSSRALDVSPIDDALLEAVVRLVRLAEAPASDAQVLLPLLQREIVFLLLRGEQSARLRQFAALGGHTDRIARAIERLRTDYDKPLRIDTLARELGMSQSSLFEHFKEVTAMTPLQFQKQIRLQEARRLLLGEDVDATTAGYRVGYEDTSQFNKEYKRLFGEPPLRDVERLRAAAQAGVPASV
jgi:AraC-like DNA-binding protein